MTDHYETKQVIIVRTDLKMPKGKLAAQVAHASMAFITRQIQDQIQGKMRKTVVLRPVEEQWIHSDFAKVVLGVPDEATFNLIVEAARLKGLTVHEIIDNGTTVFDGVPTLTCAAIGPDYSEKINEVTGGLKLL